MAFNGAPPVGRAAAIASPAKTGVAAAATASTNVAPFGYTTAAQADAIQAAANASVADIAALKVAVDALRAALTALGATA